MKTGPRYIAVFAEARSVGQYILDCRVIVERMTDNASFESPTPPLAQVTKHIDDLAEDAKLACSGGPGAVAQRDVSLEQVRIDMRMLKAYVQNVADTLGTDRTPATILSSGFTVGKRGGSPKAPLGAKHGVAPGSVVLTVKAIRGPVMYRWQASTDQETWLDLPETFDSTHIVEGFTSATLYYFRMRTVTRRGVSAWSPTISMIMH